MAPTESALPPAPPSRLGLVGVGLGMAGGLVGAVGYFVPLPLSLAVGALASFVIGLLLGMLAVYRRAHREGVGMLRALGRSLKAGGRFILDFAP